MDKSFKQLLALYETGQLNRDDLAQFFRLLEQEENQSLLSAAIDEKAANPEFKLEDNPQLTESAVLRLKKALESAREQSSGKGD